jgi:Mn2+/Fe2+ NRAMP family transporter
LVDRAKRLQNSLCKLIAGIDSISREIHGVPDGGLPEAAALISDRIPAQLLLGLQSAMSETIGVHLRQRLLLGTGPDLIVMLANTEACSVITAAQSGAEWGYRLLLPQFVLIPVLFMAQELAARVGLVTRQGLIELARRQCGPLVAVALLTTITASVSGTLATELSAIVSVGELFAVPAWQSCAAVIVGLLIIACAGNCRSVKLVALLVGLCELAFIALAWLAHPAPSEMLAESMQMPLSNHRYLWLLAANIGTCVVPWAILYQQSASTDKGLDDSSLRQMRLGTMAGAVLCQTVTAAILVTVGVTIGHGPVGRPLDQVGAIADLFTAALGTSAGRGLFAVGLSGGALVAAMVACLAASWAFRELLQVSRLLSGCQAFWFYGSFVTVLLAAGALVGSGIDVMSFSIAAGVLNALLLPVVLGLLYYMARRVLPLNVRLCGSYRMWVAFAFLLTSATGLYAAVVGVF